MSGSVSPPTTFFSILGLLPLQVNFRITLPTPTKLTWDFDRDGVKSTDQSVKKRHLTTTNSNRVSPSLTMEIQNTTWPLGKVWKSLTKLSNRALSFDAINMLLGIYPNALKIVHTKPECVSL